MGNNNNEKKIMQVTTTAYYSIIEINLASNVCENFYKSFFEFETKEIQSNFVN